MLERSVLLLAVAVWGRAMAISRAHMRMMGTPTSTLRVYLQYFSSPMSHLKRGSLVFDGRPWERGCLEFREIRTELAQDCPAPPVYTQDAVASHS